MHNIHKKVLRKEGIQKRRGKKKKIEIKEWERTALQLTLQVGDDKVVVEFDGTVLLHLVLQLKDGVLHVANLLILLLQLQPLLLQGALLLRQLLMHLTAERPKVTLQLGGRDKDTSTNGLEMHPGTGITEDVFDEVLCC